MASPFPAGPPRPRPGYYPPQNPNFQSNPNPNPNPQPPPNLADAMQNLQIARPPPPSAAPRGPFSSSTQIRPGPPPSQFSRPPIASNGPPGAPRFGPPIPAPNAVRPFPGSQQQAPPFSGQPPQQPPPFSGPQPAPSAPQPFPGSPPAGPPFGQPPSPPSHLYSQQPFSGPPSMQQQQPFSGPPSMQQQQPFSGPLSMQQQPFSVPPSMQHQHQPFSGPPSMQQQPFSGPPPMQQQPFSGPPPMQQQQQSFPGSPLMQQPQPFPGPPPTSGAPQQPQPPFSWQPPPSATPFRGPSPPFGDQSFGAQGWPQQTQPGAPFTSGTAPVPQRMYGVQTGTPGQLPLGPPGIGNASTPSKIDPNQIPRPMPSSSVAVFETRQGNQANVPPPATSDFIVKDNGNCSPRLMRCTINQIPCTGDLLSTSSMPLALMVQPLALPHPSEEPIQVVDFGERGPLRCSRCKGYINPFMRFVDQGRHFICNLCGFTDETPREYHCNLGPDGRRRDADDRPELCRGTVEFVATKEYMVRDPMPAVFFFLIDVSMNAIQTGATAAACSAMYQAIADLPVGPQTMVGIATFDSAIHFYNLKQVLQQPLMLIVPDVQDVYTPLNTDLIVQLSECRQHLEQLLDNIPTIFENNRVAESAFGAATKAAFLALKPTGGKLLVFQSVLPSIGIGSLSSREAEGRTNFLSGDKEAHKLFQPADKTLNTMAIEFAEHQVCVDIFITSQTFVDIASISIVPRITGGQVYYYFPFSALSDSAKLYNDLRWNVSRPQGFEAVMRVRCSQGVQVQEYSGNFCKRIPTDIDLPAIDCDKTIMVTFKHDDKFQEGSECAFQCALLYTTVDGQRRIRVTNLSLPCTSMLSNLFRSADLDTQFACFLKQAATGIPASPLTQVREQITNLCINILLSYRKFCASVSSSGQLILPEALKLLPLYTLALTKSAGLRNEGRLDDRSYWIAHATSLSIALAVPLVYPRMIAIHDSSSKDEDESINSTIPLSSEHVSDGGIYLLENGEDCFIYVGNAVEPDILQQFFGVATVDGIPAQLILEQYDNDLSKKLNNIVNQIRLQRSSYLRLRLCRKGDPSGMLFFSYMVEDKAPGGISYVEFLVHIHRQIQTKMP